MAISAVRIKEIKEKWQEQTAKVQLSPSPVETPLGTVELPRNGQQKKGRLFRPLTVTVIVLRRSRARFVS